MMNALAADNTLATAAKSIADHYGAWARELDCRCEHHLKDGGVASSSGLGKR